MKKPQTEFQVCSLEEAEEYARKRNYHYTNTDNPIDFPKKDELEEIIMKYWLCCGGKEPNHHLYYYCTEGNAGHPERVRYGTKEEHHAWSKEFYSKENT